MRSAHMLTWPSAESKGLQDSEEERGEPQRFKFLCQCIGDTAAQALTCRPILSRHYASMMQDGLQIVGTLGGGGGVLPPHPTRIYTLPPACATG